MGAKTVILTQKTAPHPMDVGRNRVRGGRRERDDAGGGGEQGGAFLARGRFPMGRRCGSVGGARCAHRNKKRNARMRRAGMHAMRRLLWPMRTLMMLAR